MRWYVNDTSLQNQYSTEPEFVAAVEELLKARARFAKLRMGIYTPRTISQAVVAGGRSLSEVVTRTGRADFIRQVLLWVTSRGPFIDDDRLDEPDDYFECLQIDVTNNGAGEAARRAKANQPVALYSFPGGQVNFCVDPLPVDHGLDGDRLGRHEIKNVWTVQSLTELALASEDEVQSWQSLIEVARERYPLLVLPDSIFENRSLVAEPFEKSIAERALQLLSHLNEYANSLDETKQPTARSQEIVRDLFTNASGAEPSFTGESQGNQIAFASEMTFPDPDDPKSTIFAHWHGKIRHRFFRMHFEWPLPAGAGRIKVLYLGPKLTKG